MAHEIDADFIALPLRSLTDAALTRAAQLGAEHADLRVMRTRQLVGSTRDGRVENSGSDEALAMAVRVVHDGSWGFAASDVLTPDEAVRLADRAVALARVSRPMSTTPVVLAPEQVFGSVDSPARWIW